MLVLGLLAGLKVATSLIVWQPAEDWQPLFDQFFGFLSGTEQAAILTRLQQVIWIEQRDNQANGKSKKKKTFFVELGSTPHINNVHLPSPSQFFFSLCAAGLGFAYI
jgi:hypothetical protein